MATIVIVKFGDLSVLKEVNMGEFFLMPHDTLLLLTMSGRQPGAAERTLFFFAPNLAGLHPIVSRLKAIGAETHERIKDLARNSVIYGETVYE